MTQCSAKTLEKWELMTHTTEKYGDTGNFSGVTYVILPFINLKFRGTWAPTAKIVGDIPDFNVLNVPKTQPRHNPVDTWSMTMNMQYYNHMKFKLPITNRTCHPLVAITDTTILVLYHLKIWYHSSSTSKDFTVYFFQQCWHWIRYNATWWIHLTLLRAIFFRENINIYLHFMSFLHTNKPQVVEIPPRVRQGPAYST